MTNGEGPVEVLVGVHGDIEWRVMVSGTTSDLMTMLELRRGGRRLSSSGFGGPALPPGSLVNEWRGRSGDRPWFVMARADPAVTRLVAQTDRGRQVELSLGEVDPRSGLRFAVTGLPDGEAPGVLLVEAVGHPTGSIPQPIPGRGW